MSLPSTALPDPHWGQSRAEELANTLSHGAGLLAALIAGPVLIATAWARGDGLFLAGAIVYAVTIVLLYLGSTLYHAWPQTPMKFVFQVIDHSAIFLLIAGTYTPFTLGPLRGPWGWSILAIVWPLAFLGIAMKIRRGVSRPKLSIALYLGMGWMILFAMRPLILTVSTPTLAWLVAGGIAYTGGVIFFVRDRVRPFNHFLWHLFVLAGTACHYCAIFAYAS